MVTFYRRLPEFGCVKPKTVDDALNILGMQDNETMSVFAGGTDLIPQMKRRVDPMPSKLLDLKGISGLDYIHCGPEEGLRIGALTTLSEVVESQVVRDRFPILAQAAGTIASKQVRNRGTLMGNICNAVPSADSVPALLALNARVRCVNSDQERWVNLSDFFGGPGKTVLSRGELALEIQVPNPPEDCHGLYIKLSPRRQMDLAVVGVGVSASVSDGVCREIRIGLGAVGPTPLRARKAEEMLQGQKADTELVSRAARIAATECRPIDDHRASAEYRIWMVEALVGRAVGQTLGLQ